MKKYLLIILIPLILLSCLQPPAESSLEKIVSMPSLGWNTVPALGSSIIRSIAYDGTRHVAVGEKSYIATSRTGTSGWSTVTVAPNINFRSVVWNGKQGDENRFVAVGYSTITDRGIIAVSNNNGTSWDTGIDVPELKVQIDGFGTMTINPKLFGIAYGNGRFVVVGEQGYSAWSNDGENWTAVWIAPFSQYGFQINNQNANTVVFGGGMFVTGGTMGVLAYSTSRGENWEWAANGLLGGNYDHILTITYGSGIFIAAGSQGKMKTLNINQSSIIPASNWVSPNSGFSNYTNINAVSYGNGVFVAAGDAGRICMSVDASSWNAVTFNGWDSNDNIYSAAYGACFVTGSNGLFIYGSFR